MFEIEKQIGVMQQALQLTETMLEGLNYINQCKTNSMYSYSQGLLDDTVVAFGSIQRAIPVVTDIEEDNILNMLTEQIEHALATTLVKVTQGSDGELDKEVLPLIMQWQKEMERVFHPYVLN